MLWCFGSFAFGMVLLALVALTSHPLRVISRLKPTDLIRGCLALICLSLALSFVVLALLLER